MQLQQLVKALSVLSRVDGVGRSTHNVYAVSSKVFGKLYSGLSAESYYYAVWLLYPDYIHYVFVSQRLEIKSVRSIEVGGYSFGVVVYYNYVKAFFFQRPYAVYRSVVELYALTYSDRT